MQLTSLLEPTSRLIDVGVSDPSLARRLAALGFPRYLGLVLPDRLTAVRRAGGVLACRFHPLTSTEQAVRCSTDVLIVRAGFGRCLWALQDLRHIRYIAVEAGPATMGVEAVGARLVGRLAGKMRRRGRYTCDGQEFEVLELAGQRVPTPRHYLSPVWGVAGLVQRLQDSGIRYATLRWFESLPELEPGEDLDMLVADADLPRLQKMLLEEPGTIPVDVYSETGLPGSDYQGVAYYPPALAAEILDGAVVHASGCRVPAPLEHLRSLAYHALYHKGGRSGLPSTVLDGRHPDPEHDYTTALEDLVRAVGVQVEVSLEGLDAYLAEVGWRPPPDTLRRLSAANPWIQQRFAPAQEVRAEPPEPAVFLVREEALTVLELDDILRALDTLGFEVLRVRELDEQGRTRCAQQMRGGNWGRGPYPRSGGRPAIAVVTLHYGPRAPEPEVRERYPRLSNKDVLGAKLLVRDLVLDRVPADQQFNAMHSSDEEVEAWEYVEIALPEEAEELRAEVARRRAEYRTDLPVLRELSRGRRSKVELVQGADGPVVRKTYAPAHRRYMARELRAFRTLSPRIAAVPQVLDSGPTWFTCPYYENALKGVGDRPGGRLVPLGVAREMVAVLREVHELGVDLVDAKPQNFLLDVHEGLKLVDFEFFHQYPGAPPDFTEIYSFAGIPREYAGDVPVGDLSYGATWLPYTGLSLRALLESPAWRQHLQRTVFRVRRAAVGPTGPVRTAARRSRTEMRRARRHAAWRYREWARSRALTPVGESTW